MAEMWQRQSGESAKAFRAFMAYRDLGRNRSQEKARVKLGRNLGYIKMIAEWSSKYNWVERAAAYDAHLDSEHLEAQRKAVVDMADRQARQAAMLQTIALSKFTNLPRGEDGRVDLSSLNKMSFADAIRIFEGAVKIERVARGEPEVPIKITEETVVRVDNMEELRDLMRAAKEYDDNDSVRDTACGD